MVWQHKRSLPKRNLKIFCPREVLLHDANYFDLIDQTILRQSMSCAISLTVLYRFLILMSILLLQNVCYSP